MFARPNPARSRQLLKININRMSVVPPLFFCSLQPDYISDYVSDCSVSFGSPTRSHYEAPRVASAATYSKTAFLLRWRTRESHQTRLTGRRGSGEAAERRLGEGRFFSSFPHGSPDGVGEGSGVIVTVYPVLQRAH